MGTHTHIYRTLWKHLHANRDAEPTIHKEKRWDTAATRDDLNFHMDRSFILERNKRQTCHPAEHCVCSLNVSEKILAYFEEDRALISQLTLLQPSFVTWLGHGNRLNKHCMFTQQQVKRLSITSLHPFLTLPLCPSANEWYIYPAVPPVGGSSSGRWPHMDMFWHQHICILWPGKSEAVVNLHPPGHTSWMSSAGLTASTKLETQLDIAQGLYLTSLSLYHIFQPRDPCQTN